MNFVGPVLESNPNVKITVIDKDEPGGICLTRACIPSKLLIYPADLVRLIQIERPAWITDNRVILDLKTLKLRNFSKGEDGINILIVPPYSGHISTIVDFAPEQSLVETLLKNGIKKVYSIDWKSATEETKYYDIDNYLGELDICVDELGGRVNLVGMSQSG